jgi:hypothetical protein
MFAAVGAVALLAAAPAMAATGYVGAAYTRAEVDTGAGDTDSDAFGVEGAVAFNATKSLGLDIDAGYTDSDDTDSTSGITGHLSGKSGATTVDDAGLAHLAKVPSLRTLMLDFLWVSEQGLDALAPAGAARDLAAYAVCLSAAGRAAARAAQHREAGRSGGAHGGRAGAAGWHSRLTTPARRCAVQATKHARATRGRDRSARASAACIGVMFAGMTATSGTRYAVASQDKVNILWRAIVQALAPGGAAQRFLL